ncbi:MAG: DUF1512 domain-containing protein [Nanoarchaeota archaeon]|nr:DUF1512 domain-containing protein [Nanoarchaeota archaeon]
MQEVFLSQFFGNDIWGTLISFVLIFVLIIFGPRLMTTQTIWKLEKDVAELEMMAERSRVNTVKKFLKKPSRETQDRIKNFMDFQIAEPVSTDPFGIIKKIDAVLKQAENRHKVFVDSIAPGLGEEEKKNFRAALLHTSGVHQIAKIMRHLLETIKKYKIFQLALILQMQFPMIKKIADGLADSVEAFTKGLPIGDAIGPIIISNYIPKGKAREMKDADFVYYRTKIAGRNVILSRAKGPGVSIGYPEKFVENILKKEKITRIITVDAAMGLEGEKPGSVAEGVGFGQRGSNPVASFYIEEMAVKKGIPVDDIMIKEIGEQALQVLAKPILESLPKASEALEDAIKRAGKSEKILVIGLGNTGGVGNDKSGVAPAVEKLKKYYRETEAKEKAEKKGWFGF